jgi:hypothetical protein
MNARPSYTIVPSSARARPVQDEWSLLDPGEAGLGAIKSVHVINSAKGSDAAPAPGAAEAADDEVYELALPEPEPDAAPEPARSSADNGAVYTLEFPTRCPQCRKSITTVRVSRLLRTQVSFTSLLPRKGYVIVCPECDGMLSAELSGLI